MSPIGRIFLVLNLILSAVFLGWASNVLATSQQYKTQLSDAQAEWDAAREALEADVSRLTVDLNTKQDLLGNTRTDLETLKTENDRNKADLTTEKRVSTDMRATVSNFESQLGTLSSRLDDIAAGRERAFEEARAAERARDEAVASAEEAEMARRDAEGRMNELENALADVRKELTAATRDLRKKESALASMVALYGPAPVMNTPKIDARITGVDSSHNLVMLNVGESQGVARGMEFSVYSGSVYKGKVAVMNTDDNQSSARIIAQPSGTNISQGDNATTLL